MAKKKKPKAAAKRRPITAQELSSLQKLLNLLVSQTCVFAGIREKGRASPVPIKSEDFDRAKKTLEDLRQAIEANLGFKINGIKGPSEDEMDTLIRLMDQVVAKIKSTGEDLKAFVALSVFWACHVKSEEDARLLCTLSPFSKIPKTVELVYRFRERKLPEEQSKAAAPMKSKPVRPALSGARGPDFYLLSALYIVLRTYIQSSRQF